MLYFFIQIEINIAISEQAMIEHGCIAIYDLA